MGSIAKAEQAARVKARKRRVKALDQHRRERDRRIEAAAAEVFLGLEDCARAGQLACEAETRVAAALRGLLAEHIAVSDVADLCQLTVKEVRRLSRHRRTGRSATPREGADVVEPVPTQAPNEAARPDHCPAMSPLQGQVSAVRSKSPNPTRSSAERSTWTPEDTLF